MAVLLMQPQLNGWAPSVCAYQVQTAGAAFTDICNYSSLMYGRPVFFVTSGGVYGATIEWNGAKYSTTPADCVNTSPYVHTFGGGSGNSRFAVDLVGAYAAGVWTSSTVINVYHRNLNGTAPVARSFGGRWGKCTETLVSKASSAAGVNCSTNLMATITVLDDGTFTVT